MDATGLWAQITASGAVNASSPGVKALNTGTGTYDVNFGTDITECAARRDAGIDPQLQRRGDVDNRHSRPAFVTCGQRRSRSRARLSERQLGRGADEAH